MATATKAAGVAAAGLGLAALLGATSLAIPGTQADASTVTHIIDRYGFAAVLLLVLVVGAMRFSRFAGPIVAEWLREQVRLSRVVCDAMPGLQASMQVIAQQAETLPGKIDKLEEGHRETSAKLDQLLAAGSCKQRETT